MAKRLYKPIVVALLILAVGGHWIVIQSVAWINMAAENSRTMSFAQALVEAIGGKNPCNICKFVQAGKQEEQKQDAHKLITKLDLFLVANSLTIYPPRIPDQRYFLTSSFDSELEPPPFPPPRFA